ncbi:hypothetical protein SAMN05421595_3090 [Austwickia chelonae]|nr:hypothetical protein [Austwickia chelonae]SEW43827.1 hypothetical protein SAMN05421595_3090 [Austwickia chelonae]
MSELRSEETSPRWSWPRLDGVESTLGVVMAVTTILLVVGLPPLSRTALTVVLTGAASLLCLYLGVKKGYRGDREHTPYYFVGALGWGILSMSIFLSSRAGH